MLSFFIQFKNERLKFYRLSGATVYNCIDIIYQFIKSFLDYKMSVFEEYVAFKPNKDHHNSIVPMLLRHHDIKVTLELLYHVLCLLG